MKSKPGVWIFIAILLVILAFIASGFLVTFNKKSVINHAPIEGYRVYLEGKAIGLIKSKDELKN